MAANCPHCGTLLTKKEAALPRCPVCKNSGRTESDRLSKGRPGWSNEIEKVDRPTVDRGDVVAGAQRNMLVGGLVCVVGLFVTIGSYASASRNGGSYVIAWGAMLFGAVQFITGVAQLGDPPERGG